VIELRDGRVLTGAVRTEGDRLHVGDLLGQVTTVPRDQVNSMISSAVSVMPKVQPKLLGPDGMRDLLTFVPTEPGRSKEDSHRDAKAQRDEDNKDRTAAGKFFFRSHFAPWRLSEGFLYYLTMRGSPLR
jgi:hypothetical protein